MASENSIIVEKNKKVRTLKFLIDEVLAKETKEATDPTYHVLYLKTTNLQSKNKTHFLVRNITIFFMLDVKSKH